MKPRLYLAATVVLLAGAIAAPATAADGPKIVANPESVTISDLAPGQTRTITSVVENTSTDDASVYTTAVATGTITTAESPLSLTIDTCTKPWAVTSAGALRCDQIATPVVTNWAIVGTVSTKSTFRVNGGAKVYVRTQVSLGAEADQATQGRSGTLAYTFTGTAIVTPRPTPEPSAPPAPEPSIPPEDLVVWPDEVVGQPQATPTKTTTPEATPPPEEVPAEATEEPAVARPTRKPSAAPTPKAEVVAAPEENRIFGMPPAAAATAAGITAAGGLSAWFFIPFFKRKKQAEEQALTPPGPDTPPQI